MKKLMLIAVLAVSTLLAGCATQLGQEYGTAGAVGGAVIGGAGGGLRGAVIGGAAGAIIGGAVGDQETFHNGQPYGYGPYQQCWFERVPVYDGWGHFEGYGSRRVCR